MVEERAPKVVRNWGMVITGPIVPVSRLGRLEVESGVMEKGREGHPKSAPPMEMCVACWMYFSNSAD